MIRAKKGFTLVELLAVIVILAIIMIIATQSVGKTVTKSRTQAFDETMQLAAKNAKRILQTDGTLNTELLQNSLGYSTNEYDLDVIPVDNGYIVRLISNETGKFKNVDFTEIAKNTDWEYTEDADGESGKNIISFKIDSAGDLKEIAEDGDDKKIAENRLPNNCTIITEENRYNPNKSSEENIGKMISFCNNDVVYKYYGQYVKGKSEDFYVINVSNKKVTLLSKEYIFLEDIFSNGVNFKGLQYMKFDYSLEKNNLTVFTTIDTATRKLNTVGFYGYWAQEEKNGKRYSPKEEKYFPVYAYNDKASIRKYVDNYVDNLKKIFGKSTIIGRLLSKDDLNRFGYIYDASSGLYSCSEEQKDNILNKNVERPYWTGVARDEEKIVVIDKYKSRILAIRDFHSSYTLRPVIEINKSEI